MEQLHAIVYGRVQGVSFRAYMQRDARALGISGWIRNRPNGTVETVSEGERGALEEFLARLRRGSPHAFVTRVEADWNPAQGTFSDFSILY